MRSITTDGPYDDPDRIRPLPLQKFQSHFLNRKSCITVEEPAPGSEYGNAMVRPHALSTNKSATNMTSRLYWLIRSEELFQFLR